MDAPLTTFKTKPWTNTPEARAKLAETSATRALVRKTWVHRQIEAGHLLIQPLQGPR